MLPNPQQTENFHQAQWQEPILLQLSTPGERGVVVEEAEAGIEAEVGDGISVLPPGIRRQTPPALPEMAQMRVLRHYLRLSQETLGADLNIDIGQGTCTMKYSPKVHEQLVHTPKVTEVHPLQDDRTVQGSLEILHQTDLYLREISGMDQFTFQPRSGTQGILTIASIIRAFHRANGHGATKDEIVTTIFSHPSDAAAAHVLGFKIVTLSPEADGLPSVAGLRQALSERTAGLLITNPEDTGIFNPHIEQFTEMVHRAGGLCGYDQANANGLLGITRAREAGFDLCFFNLHKTFSVPHCCGGPAVGAVGVVEQLARFLPVPLVTFDGERYAFDADRPDSIGKVGGFHGVIPAVIRAYAWIRSLGAAGLREVARVAVLNNNYVLRKVLQLPGVSAPYAAGHHRIEQVRCSWQALHEETGVTTEDITRRLADHGMHMWSSHHPFIVPQPMTLEPTESYSRKELDQYVAALGSVVNEARTCPEVVRTAPHRSTIHRVRHEALDDPRRWAMTWRAYVRKHGPVM